MEGSSGELPNGSQQSQDTQLDNSVETLGSEKNASHANDVDELGAKASDMSLQDMQNVANSEQMSIAEPDQRFDALVRDRDSLRVEVAELRRSLEEIQSKHDEEMNTVQKKLRSAQDEKEHAESQFQNLLGKVNTIRSQLGERLKADAVCCVALPQRTPFTLANVW